MGINATLIGQMITFAVFVWFMMKFIWPPLTQAMQERQKRIADGLAAAEQGSEQLDKAREEADKILRAARDQASEILAQANKRGNETVEQAKVEARSEGERLITAAQTEIEQERVRARESLRKEVATLAVTAAGRILEREVDAASHERLIDDLVSQV